jgi:hypothetical protein
MILALSLRSTTSPGWRIVRRCYHAVVSIPDVESILFQKLATYSDTVQQDLGTLYQLMYLGRSPKRSMVHVTQHALGIIGICRINQSFVLVYKPIDEHIRFTSFTSNDKKSYGELKADCTCKCLDLIKIKFYRWVVGAVVFEVPKKRSCLRPRKQ